MKCCVTGVGGPAGVVAARYISDAGADVVGVDADPISAGRRFCSDFTTVPYATDDRFISCLVEFCKANDVDVLIPTVDAELGPIADSKEKLRSSGISAVVSSKTTIDSVNDKYEFFEYLSDSEFRLPETWVPATPDDIPSDRYPVVVKPRRGRGSQDVYICHDDAELRFALARSDSPVVQEYVDGDEYTIDTLSDLHGDPLVAIPRQRIETKGGVSWKGRTVDDETLRESALSLASTFQLIGPANIQVIRTETGEDYVIEINPRFGGTTSLTIEAGVNTPALLLDLLKGNRITDPNRLDYDEIIISRYFEDVIHEFEGA